VRDPATAGAYTSGGHLNLERKRGRAAHALTSHPEVRPHDGRPDVRRPNVSPKNNYAYASPFSHNTYLAVAMQPDSSRPEVLRRDAQPGKWPPP